MFKVFLSQLCSCISAHVHLPQLGEAGVDALLQRVLRPLYHIHLLLQLGLHGVAKELVAPATLPQDHALHGDLEGHKGGSQRPLHLLLRLTRANDCWVKCLLSMSCGFRCNKVKVLAVGPEDFYADLVRSTFLLQLLLLLICWVHQRKGIHLSVQLLCRGLQGVPPAGNVPHPLSQPAGAVTLVPASLRERDMVRVRQVSHLCSELVNSEGLTAAVFGRETEQPSPYWWSRCVTFVPLGVCPVSSASVAPLFQTAACCHGPSQAHCTWAQAWCWMRPCSLQTEGQADRRIDRQTNDWIDRWTGFIDLQTTGRTNSTASIMPRLQQEQ